MFFDEVHDYYDRAVQFVILLNMTHLDNIMVFTFPKHHLKKYDYNNSWIIYP